MINVDDVTNATCKSGGKYWKICLFVVVSLMIPGILFADVIVFKDDVVINDASIEVAEGDSVKVKWKGEKILIPRKSIEEIIEKNDFVEKHERTTQYLDSGNYILPDNYKELKIYIRDCQRFPASGLGLPSMAAVPTSPAKAPESHDAFGLSWNLVIGEGTYEASAVEMKVQMKGLVIETFMGNKISSEIDLEYGISPSIMITDGQFHDTYDAGFGLQDWTVKTYLVGPALMAKYRLRHNLGKASVSLENGFGLSYLFERVVWEWRDRKHSDMHDNATHEYYSLNPVIDLMFIVDYPISLASRFGLAIGYLYEPIHTGDLTISGFWKMGLRYMVYF